MRARTPLLLLCLNAVPALCVGQHTHQFEIGAFGSYTRYDHAFMLDTQIGGGGRLGYFFSPVVGIEVDAGYQQPTPAAGGSNASLQLGSASLVLNVGNQHNLFYILGGYSRLAFGDRSGYTFTDNGVHGAIGDRVFLGERVALRIEGRAIYAPKTGFSSGNWAGHIVGSLGLAIFTGPSAFRDADLDGVADGKDACPGTPVGAVVDARGCPSDSDRDKVYNGLDACPNTVEGAEVDARGCPKDSDGDGVYDGIDKCPGTATGARVDAQGCPTDSDRDGVPDGPDQCPNTPAGATVTGRDRPARRRGRNRADRKSTRLNSSHSQISYAVFCFKKKKKKRPEELRCVPEGVSRGRRRVQDRLEESDDDEPGHPIEGDRMFPVSICFSGARRRERT